MEVSDEAYLMGKIIDNVDKSYLFTKPDQIVEAYKKILTTVRNSKDEVKKTTKSKAINY